jgi:hypothetical protein
MSSRALTGPKRMVVEIPSYNGEYDAGTGLWTGDNDWGGSGNAIFIDRFLDLSGYELDKLTLIVTGAGLQDPGKYTCSDPLVYFEVVDIISEGRITAAELIAALGDGSIPGMLATTNEFHEIKMGNYRLMSPNTNLLAGLLTTTQAGSFASGDPTTNSRLYVTRFVLASGPATPGATLTVPASRAILTGSVIEEPDLVYMQRLKRSYELQQL